MQCLHIFYELFRHISTLTQQFNIVHKVSHSFLGRPIAPLHFHLEMADVVTPG